ncbi:MAG: OmpA family protein [Bacteroidales bacterium]|nr:OmpA family protein [Bacteroidales bacterium]
MKKFISIIACICFSTIIWGQSGYLKLIENGKYSKAEKKIIKDLEKNPNDIELNYYKARLYMVPAYKNYNTKQSYKLLVDTRSAYRKITDDKEQKKLSKIPLDTDVLNKYIDTVCILALDDAIKLNTEEVYLDYLSYYSLMSTKCNKTATENRNTVAYSNACDENTADSYQKFMTKYPNAEQYNLAKNKRNALEFNSAKELDKIESYKSFIAKYPDADEVKLAWERIHELAFEDAKNVNTAAAYKKYVDDYPTSKLYDKAFDNYEEKLFNETTSPSDWRSYQRFVVRNPKNSWNAVALDSLFYHAELLEDLESLKFCVDNMKGDKRQTALIQYYKSFTIDGDLETLKLFFEKYDDDVLDEIKIHDIDVALAGYQLDLFYTYDSKKYADYEDYIKSASARDLAFVAIQRVISDYLNKKDWKSAISKLKYFETVFYERPDNLNNLISLLEAPVDRSIIVNNMGANINTSEGGEYVPVISADDKQIYFCAKDRKDNIGGEDIFVSKKTNGVWGPSKIVSELSAMFSNDAPISLSTDGTVLMLFKNGNLFFSKKTNIGWDIPVELSKNINSGSWQADAMITSDGKALVFTSTRKGGYNLHENSDGYHGDSQYPSDIWVSLKDSKGEWGIPINMGSTINTRYCERSPFLHPDMKTLYFSSDGHGGLGKLDVFKSTRLSDTCWNCWSEPINMGKEINTADSDWGYKISTDGEKAYFAKLRSGSEEYDIFWLKLPDNLRPDMVATVSGKLVDKDSNPVSAEILWEDLETGKTVGQSQSDPKDGSFFIVLPLGKIYGYYVDEDKYFPISNNVDLRNVKKQVVIEENIDMVTFEQMVEIGTAVPVNNLFFNFGESTLLQYSLPELKRVADIIKVNNLKVELSGHTDNIGTAEDNQILSEKRALAVRDFLVNEGCSESLFTIVGYGMTKPVEKNDTESGRAKNRRVEMRFVE